VPCKRLAGEARLLLQAGGQHPRGPSRPYRRRGFWRWYWDIVTVSEAEIVPKRPSERLSAFPNLLPGRATDPEVSSPGKPSGRAPPARSTFSFAATTVGRPANLLRRDCPENSIGPRDREPTGDLSTADAEAAAAVDATAAEPVYADLPILQSDELRVEWKGEGPVLCIAGRTALDEAAAIMFSQLCGAHGLHAHVKGPEALATANIFRLKTEGVALVCLSYLNTTNSAHIRFAVRRLRRKLPGAKIMVGLWAGLDVERSATLLENSKADMWASTLREAIRVCITSAQQDPDVIRDNREAQRQISV
jgi:hypothetical protein